MSLADLLTKTGATLPSPLYPVLVIADKAHPLRYLEAKSFSQFSLLLDSFGVLRGTSPFAHRPL